MPTRTQLLERVLRGDTYEAIGAHFGIPPGQAYMIATGLPADGSDVLSEEELEGRVGLGEQSTQQLVNPPTDITMHAKMVKKWMKGRARGRRGDAPGG